jgi:phosphohistidine phosphatase
MKTLTLLRHAKSGWDDPVPRDFDRPLNARGRRAAETVGREMRKQALEFDRVLASPAVRVEQTIAGIAEGLGRDLAQRSDRRLYLASASALLDVVHETGEGEERLLIIGHNPGLETLALLLTGADASGFREQVEIKYPTAMLVEISLPVARWEDVEEGQGTITRLIRPRDLDPELGPEF